MITLDLIKNGQGPRLAFLEQPDAQAIAETLVAFANTEGGTIVIGLKQDGTQIDDVLNPDDMQKAMIEADDLYNPPVVVDKWEEIELSEVDDDDADDDDSASTASSTYDSDDDETDDSDSDTVDDESDDDTVDTKAEENSDAEDDDDQTDDDVTESETPVTTDTPTMKVFALRVPRSIELHALHDGRVLIRSGEQNRPLGGQEILRLASAKSTGDFESEVVPGTTKADFNQDMIDEYLAKRAERTKRPFNGKVDSLLQEIGAITADGKPTVTGILLFTEYPQQWLPQSSVVFAKFVGTTPRGESGLAGYTRREELTGSLPRLIEQSWNLIWSEMAVSAVVKGLEREEKTEYPQFAVREAIVNAICHRDYRLRGRRIELRMYSDRLEVISPGGLPGFITIENIKDEHFSRNPRVVNGLFQWGYIEELGLGIDRMIEVMEQAGHQPPTFDARPYSFAVTLYNEREKPKPPEWMRNTNHRQAKALQYIREQGSITNREYRQLCDGVSAETLRLDLVDMVEKGILIKVGSKKGTYYILK
jgi:ATP-dependent DNA helicase RecG